MIVRFVSADGTATIEAQASPGDRLLDLAQAYGQPLEGTCEGQLACATCHVIVAPEHSARLAPPAEEEEDMLDLVRDATRTSRLACQIWLDATLDGLTVRMPGSAR